ncbi:hypothetical protein Afer_0207 [Acidimicrobium ferrooxidans DSM 10331]|uniref:Uncharacterized protein n=1 Tax=Acidimicrobium ferrooxidans (strain DSM 10331 / JCM 15462 / NBRC 103882 / ICP) TaxID=525909 RepID=C7M278_ACIFD|nr:hypothetical protein [Acidimicrobium ferrooxidans]ACU53176.1 hypothetical protein Afer_0207 [Acidimicrobium ferrooxidans DSM 10331]
MSPSTIAQALDDVEVALTALEAALDRDDVAALGPASNELARAAVSLGSLVAEEAPVDALDRERYRSLMPRVDAVVAGCAWRAMLVAQLLRDLGADLGIYGPDGLLEVTIPERSSQLA